MVTKQPKWKFIANLGDRHPLESGGYFIYRDETGVYADEAELLLIDDENVDIEDTTYTVYRFGLDRLKMVDGYLVPFSYDSSWPHPLDRYDEWFHEDLGKVAEFVGASKKSLEDSLTSKDPVVRAEAYRAIGEYHGWENLDSYPLTGMTYKEAKKRYPERTP